MFHWLVHQLKDALCTGYGTLHLRINVADNLDGAEELLDIEEEGDHNTNRYLMIDGEPAAKTRDNCRCEGTQ